MTDLWSALGATCSTPTSRPDAPHGRRVQRILFNTTGDYVYSTTFAVSDKQQLFGIYSRRLSGSGTVVMELRQYSPNILLGTVTLATGALFQRVSNTCSTPGAGTICYLKICPTSGTPLTIDVDAAFCKSLSNMNVDHGMFSDFWEVNEHMDWSWDNASGAPYGPGTNQMSRHKITLDVVNVPGSLPPDLRVRVSESVGYGMTHPILALLSCPKAHRTFPVLQAENATPHNSPILRTVAAAWGAGTNNCYELLLSPTGLEFLELYLSDDDVLRLAGKRARFYARIGNVTGTALDYAVQWGVVGSHSSLVSSIPEPADYFTAPLSRGGRVSTGGSSPGRSCTSRRRRRGPRRTSTSSKAACSSSPGAPTRSTATSTR